MLRNKVFLKCLNSIHHNPTKNICQGINANGSLNAKATGINHRAKIMGKLFGSRVSGSKKHWYPSKDEIPGAALFNPSKLGRPSGVGTGKSTTRRMVVLNKLFMERITDLLATGETSEAIIGEGLQITRVKITQNFACINVYWLGNGDPIKEAKLEKELQKCSGFLRHELSQLYLIGHIPRIYFMRDKTFSNLAQVEGLMKTISFELEASNDDEVTQHYDNHNLMQQEFYGQSITSTEETSQNEDKLSMPQMRHDVFGLNHRDIVSKIMSKMRKSKQAWDVHNKSGILPTDIQSLNTDIENERLKHGLEQNKDYNKYIAQRTDRRNTPPRKKHERMAVMMDSQDAGDSLEPINFNDGDYMYDDCDEKKQ
ncbi:uncharacterized protein LOC119669690 [Teleopsis dalmanni]|uniref:uncharacterized protein LOC119669690 n=1 Tax=Teleopsis dalmanni TaxID=139649 RepID=UPI0018CF96D5|nr:uncharacterized protein LOC119669690 [Teleopsis dalmanni]